MPTQNVNQTTTTTTQVPQWMEEPLVRMIKSGESLAGQPYTPYQGPRISGFTPDQQTSFQGVRDNAYAGINSLGQAQSYVDQSAMGIPDMNVQQYMNPFLQAAIDPAALELERAYQKDLNAIRAEAAANDAFGGSRQAIREGTVQRNFQENLADLYARGLAGGYDRATALYSDDRNRMANAGQLTSGIGELTQAMGLRGSEALLKSGEVQRQHEQENLNLAYEDFLEQRNWPYAQLSYLNSLIRGIPQIGTTQTVQTGQAPNQTSQALGAGIASLGLLDRLGAFQ